MILYEGQNHSGTGEVVVIATGIDKPSANRKTGPMVQIYILPRDTLPTEAVKTGEDALVCGDCPLRPTLGGGCYVNVGQAPNSIWRKYKRGGYGKWNFMHGFKYPVRIGAYGDVAEIPGGVVELIIGSAVLGHTCYTAQWRTRPDLRDISMASVTDLFDMLEARALGWSTFRIVPDNRALKIFSEILCPAVAPPMTCAACQMCKGLVGNKQRAIYIPAHGATAKRVHAKRQEK